MNAFSAYCAAMCFALATPAAAQENCDTVDGFFVFCGEGSYYGPSPSRSSAVEIMQYEGGILRLTDTEILRFVRVGRPVTSPADLQDHAAYFADLFFVDILRGAPALIDKSPAYTIEYANDTRTYGGLLTIFAYEGAGYGIQTEWTDRVPTAEDVAAHVDVLTRITLQE